MKLIRRRLLTVIAAAVLFAASTVLAETPRAKLNLTRPMLAGGKVRLEPGDYDVAFENSPAGPPHFTAVFHRGGARVATAPAVLKGAPAGTTLADVTNYDWLRESFDYKHMRKDGSINSGNFEVKARGTRAFMEALLTEIDVPPTPKPTATKTPLTKK